MAQKVLVSLDLSSNQLLGLVLENLASDPSSPAEGRMYYNTTSNEARVYDGSQWVAVGSGSGGGDADTLGGENSAYHLSRTNHTGTQTASTISDFDTSVDARIANVVDSAPSALDTLNEIAASLNDDADFAGTMTTALASKTGKYSADIGNNSDTSIAVTHNLGSVDVIAQVRDASENVVLCDIQNTGVNETTFTFTTAPDTNEYRVTIVG